MSKFTFLTREQCFGKKETLEVIKKRGMKTAITDFSILLGASYAPDYYYYRFDNVEPPLASDNKIGWYWTRSAYDGADRCKVTAIDPFYDGYPGDVYLRWIGGRLALPFSSMDEIPTNGVSKERASDGVLEVEYGFYPQSAVSKAMQQELEEQLNNGKLNKTGNGYTTDSISADEQEKNFKAKRREEFEYKGKRYIRVKANSHEKGFELSNGEKYERGDYVWVEVEPIKWWVSEEDKLMLTEKIIFAGVQFNHEIEYHTEDFESTDIKKFIDKYWSKDIEQVRNRRTSSKN